MDIKRSNDMARLKKMMRQLTIISSTLITSLVLYSQPTYAANSSALGGASMTDQLLQYIANTTYSILEKMNTVPAYIESLTEMALSWLDTTDNGNTIANNQYAFANLMAAYNTTQGTQWDFSQNLTNQFLLAGSSSQSNPQLPGNANDLNYSIMIGNRLIKGDGDFTQNVKNFIANASGTNYIVGQPNPSWKDSLSKQRYISFYNTVSAIQSYNAYLISGLYNQQAKTQASNYLIAQASSSDWFKQVATESLGMVLRHLLMYTSESYVTLNRSVELQQQQLAAQAMTNTLLTLLGMNMVGSSLADKAIESSK
jgi:hypothetical protein